MWLLTSRNLWVLAPQIDDLRREVASMESAAAGRAEVAVAARDAMDRADFLQQRFDSRPPVVRPPLFPSHRFALSQPCSSVSTTDCSAYKKLMRTESTELQCCSRARSPSLLHMAQRCT